MESKEKYKVDVNELNKILDYLDRLNKQDLIDIQWMRDDKELQINPELIRDWKFTGLNNKDFAIAYLYYD